MAISSVVINVADLARAVEFYTRFLGVEVVELSERAARLDAVTATIRLELVDSPTDSTWVADDLQAGFRHIGFKVSDLQDRVAGLQEAGVPFQLEPIHAEGDVWITFFYDPDGTLVELVEGPLQYHEVFDQDSVDRDWGLGDPGRPRFDHVAETVADAHAAHEYFGELGYTLMGGIHQPSDDRGFEITYLRSGDSSLEIFEFQRADVALRQPQVGALGFAAVEFEGAKPSAATALDSDGPSTLFVDRDLLVHTVTGS